MVQEHTLREAIEVITSLFSLSHSIRVFTRKWQAIRNKLDELSSDLVAAENCHSGDSLELSGVVLAMMETIEESRRHARRCLDLSYSGKLLMQSDLDVVLAKLDEHIKNLSGVVTSGTLTRGHAIVVSRPVGACRDDMKFYVRDLLTRLKIGDKEMKKQALVAMNEIVVEDDKYVKIIVEVNEVVNLLVNFLDSDDTDIQEECVKVVSLIAGFEGYKGVLIGAGIIAPLVQVLECGSESGKEGSARSLKKLTANSDNAWSVSAHGGVTALLKLCTDHGECGGELFGLACGILKNVAGVEEIKRFIVEEGAISMFIKFVTSKDEALQINSMELLQRLACGDESIRQMVIKEGGISALGYILDSKSCSSSSLKSREVAVGAINSLFLTSISTINILMSHGFMDQLQNFLRNGELSIQELALKSVCQLCETSEEAKKAMGDTGFMTELIALLTAKSCEVHEMAAEALYSMVLVPKNRRRFLQEECNIGLLMQSLDPEEIGQSSNRSFLLCILIEITSSNSGRRKIVSSGYLKNIEKLAEAEVSDAKRIVRNLSTNRFRGMFSRIWHS